MKTIGAYLLFFILVITLLPIIFVMKLFWGEPREGLEYQNLF